MAVNKNNSDIIWAKYVVTKTFLDRLQKDSSLDRLGARVNGEIDLEKVREIFVNSDPNPPTNKKYFEWILLGYIDGGNHLLEDVYAHMKNTLNKFKVLVQKKQLPTQLCDLTNYCGLFGCTRKGKEKLGLLNTLNDYPDVESGTATRRNIKKDTDLVYTDQLIKVYHPKTVEASQLYGSNTQWCTAAKGKNMFNEYNQQGPLYIIIPNQPTRKGEKYQIHFQSISFMDEHDKPINNEDYLQYKKSLIDFINTIGYQVTPTKLYNQIFVEHMIDYDNTTNHIIDLLSNNTNFYNTQDPYSILFAVMNDNHSIIKQLISQGANLKIVDKNKSNLLFYAQSPDVIKLLVQSGVDINHTNIIGDTPLLKAIDKQFNNWKLLLELGANPDVINDIGQTPLGSIIQNSNKYKDKNLLFNDIKILLDANANPNVYKQNSSSPLVSAILLHLTDIARLLLNYDADPNALDFLGNTPLHYAASHSPEITQLLIDLGANPNAKSDDGFTPLDSAIIEYSINPNNVRSRDAIKILHKYSQFSHIDIDQILSEEFSELRQIQLNQMPSTKKDAIRIIQLLQDASVKYPKNIDYLIAIYDILITDIGLKLLKDNPIMKRIFQQKLLEFIQQKPEIFQKYHDILF